MKLTQYQHILPTSESLRFLIQLLFCILVHMRQNRHSFPDKLMICVVCMCACVCVHVHLCHMPHSVSKLTANMPRTGYCWPFVRITVRLLVKHEKSLETKLDLFSSYFLFSTVAETLTMFQHSVSHIHTNYQTHSHCPNASGRDSCRR